MATLAGKTVVILGGTSGIGFGVAKASLLSEAAHVVVASSTQAKVEKAIASLRDLIAQKSLPGTVAGQVVDAYKDDQVQAFFEGLGEIDHIVWTSSGTLSGPGAFDVRGITLSTVHNALSVRFWSPIVAARTAKIRSGGSITFTSGSKAPPGLGAGSGISIGAVDQLAKGLAVDLAPIRVNSIAAGYVATEFWDRVPEGMRKAVQAKALESTLVGHVADADEVAEAYLFVMKCNYVTGQRIAVEGGSLLK